MGWNLADLIKDLRGTYDETMSHMKAPQGVYVPPVVSPQSTQAQVAPPLVEQQPIQQLAPEEELLRQAQARRDRILNSGYLSAQ